MAVFRFWGFLGGALFLWIDYFIRKRPAKKASQIETQMTLNFSTTLANPDRHSMSNIRRAATNKFIIPGAALGVKTKGLPVHSTDNVCVLFLIFARPIRYGEVRVTASAGPVPPYEVKDRSPEHLIIWLMGKIENCQVKVQLHD